MVQLRIFQAAMMLLVGGFCANAQVNLVWADFEATSDNRLVESAALTPQGEFLLAGRAIGSPSTWFVNKASDNGNLAPSTDYFPGDFSFLNEMIEVSSGGQLLAGYTADFSFTSTDGKLIRNKENGTVLWSRSFAGYQFFAATEIADGQFIISGTKNEGTGEEPILLKIDPAGDLIWERPFPYTTNKLVTKLDGNVGFIAPGPALGVFDTSGHTQFDTTYALTPTMVPNDLDIDENDNLVIGGLAGTDGAILSANAVGDILYYRQYGGSGLDVIRSIRFHFEGGFVAAGSSTSADGDLPGNKGGSDMWLLILDDNADIVLSKNYGGSQNDYGTAVEIAPDADFFTAVSSSSSDGDFPGTGTVNDAWAVKWEFTRPCTGTNPPGDLSSSISPGGAKLSWRTIEGTEACRVKIASITDTTQERRFRENGDLIQEITIPSSKLTLGDLYIWRVECVCQITPRIETPLSIKDTFTYNPRLAAPLELPEIINAWPIPASDILYVNLPENSQAARLYATDLKGRLIWSGAAGAIDVSDWPAGLYHIHAGKESRTVVIQ